MIIGSFITDQTSFDDLTPHQRVSLADEVLIALVSFEGTTEDDDSIYIFWGHPHERYTSVGAHVVYLSVEFFTQVERKTSTEQVLTISGLEELGKILLTCMQQAYAETPEQRVGVQLICGHNRIWLSAFPGDGFHDGFGT